MRREQWARGLLLVLLLAPLQAGADAIVVTRARLHKFRT